MKKWILKAGLVMLSSTAAADQYVVQGDLPFFDQSPIIRDLPLARAKVIDVTADIAKRLRASGVKINPDFQLTLPAAIPASAPPTVPYFLAAIHAADANALPDGTGFGSKVCLVDSGIDVSHPGLTGVALDGINISGNGDSTDLNEYFDHGTGLAGLIHQIAPDASIYVVKIFDQTGGVSSSVAAEGIRHCIGRADVINISWGSFSGSPIIEDAINTAVAAGITVVAAAGNGSVDDIGFPARFEPVVAVSAVDENLKLAEYSNYGPGLDFVAPGSNIEVLVRGGGAAIRNGTSYSAVMVSAVEAIRISRGAHELKGRDIGYPQEKQGKGLIDALLSAVN